MAAFWLVYQIQPQIPSILGGSFSIL
uniref:Uncharacterized protein n=1 Tax=Rhizophora mucronata TaxID=61149 RepID=A0A2P2Q3A0_RHIMU